MKINKTEVLTLVVLAIAVCFELGILKFAGALKSLDSKDIMIFNILILTQSHSLSQMLLQHPGTTRGSFTGNEKKRLTAAWIVQATFITAIVVFTSNVL